MSPRRRRLVAAALIVMEITVVVGFGHSAGHHARRTLGLAGDNMGLTYEGSPEADAQMKALLQDAAARIEARQPHPDSSSAR